MSSFRTSDQIRYGTFQKSSNIYWKQTLYNAYSDRRTCHTSGIEKAKAYLTTPFRGYSADDSSIVLSFGETNDERI